MPKVKVQSIPHDSKPCTLRKSATQPPHLLNATMGEAKETTTIEDDSGDDDTEEPHQSVLIKTEETYPNAR